MIIDSIPVMLIFLFIEGGFEMDADGMEWVGREVDREVGR